MKIFIDLTSLCRTLTGIEKYTQNLALALLRQAPEDTTFHLIFRKEIHPSFSSLENERFIRVLSPFKSQFLTEQLYIPWYLRKNSFNICLFASFPPGLFVKRPVVFVCHDATMWKYSRYLSIKNRLYFKPLSEIAMRKAIKIFTVSDSAQKDISHYFPQLGTKIINISSSLPGWINKVGKLKLPPVLSRFQIKGGYLLSVSSLEPRKNMPLIIESLAPILRERDLCLVFVGRKAWGHKKILNKIETLGINKNIIISGYVSEQELQCLYFGAIAFVFASLYEGFGFPILEAFACKCPVITSNVSSMPEVAGGAALLVDPLSQESIRNAVITVLESEQLRKELVGKGTERLKSFSWDETARRFLEAISNART